MIAALTNHLWQSTLFALVAAIVAWTLRRNGAHVRHRIWVVASVKFLVPFALLMTLGRALAPVHEVPLDTPSPTVAVVVDHVAQPFAAATTGIDGQFPEPRGASRTDWLHVAAALTWICGVLAVIAVRIRGWRVIRAAMRTSSPAPDRYGVMPIDARIVPGLLEPGVVGVWKPVLLLPAGIDEQLTPPQLAAVLEHELCHVRRRDNLTSICHMAVEAICWFHPLVWWIGARMIEERERACDEHVLRARHDPESYAEGIVRVCRRYVESPIACVAGVTGASLKKRIKDITACEVGTRLTLARKTGLVVAALLAIAAPLGAGAITAPLRLVSTQVPQTSAAGPRFEAVSIKPCARPTQPGSRTSGGISTSPGRLRVDCGYVRMLINLAYVEHRDSPKSADTLDRYPFVADTEAGRPVRGGPSWLNDDRFTIEAKADGPVGDAMLLGPMLRTLLEERFQLHLRGVVEQVPMYALTVAPGGLKVAPMSADACVVGDAALSISERQSNARSLGKPLCDTLLAGSNGPNLTWEVNGQPVGAVAEALAADFGVFVLDETQVPGKFMLHLEYSPDDRTSPIGRRMHGLIDGVAPAGPPGPSLTAVLDRLGLKLQATKGPRNYFVVDRIERPSPDALLQSPAPAPQEKFDVASIKPNNSGSGQMGLNGEPVGRFVATNVTLKQLVVAAYNIQDFQLIGGPDWMTKDHFDVDAKAPPGGPSNVFEPMKGGGPTHGELMLRSLLAERFKLEARTEMRELPIYELVFAQADRKAGPGLKVSTRTCGDRDVDAPAPARPSEAPPCGAMSVPGSILSGGIPLRDLASWLSPITGRTTIDRTGSTDRFEFVLKWTPDSIPRGLSKKAGSTHWAAIDDDGPSLSTALKEQLGLKLDSKTGPVKVVVIDGVSRLIPN